MYAEKNTLLIQMTSNGLLDICREKELLKTLLIKYNLLIKELTTKDTNQTYTYTYEYDVNGNLIKETYKSNGSPITTQYTYNLVYIPYDIDKLPHSTKSILEGYSIFLNSIN